MGRDYGLILGELGRTAPHAHYAHQLMISKGSPITVSLDGHVTMAHRLFIPSRQTHAILETQGEVSVLYAEPAMFDLAPLFAVIRRAQAAIPLWFIGQPLLCQEGHPDRNHEQQNQAVRLPKPTRDKPKQECRRLAD